MKKGKLLFLFATILVSNLFAEPVDKIAATVNDNVILQSEVDIAYQEIKAGGQQTENLTKSDILQLLVDENLILTKAYNEGIFAEDAQVDRRLDQAIRDISSNFQSHQQFLQALQMEGLSLDELKKRYREQISKQIVKEQILNQKVYAKINISEHDKTKFYETHKNSFPKRPKTVKIGEIVIEPQTGSAGLDTAKDTIQNLKAKLDRGANFAELATEYSECPSASQGGDLGFFGRGEMVKPFSDAAFALEIGEISQPVLTQYGYHLIMLEDKKDGEIRVRHILIKTEIDDSDMEQAANNIGEALTKLQNGADFIEVAKEYSGSTQSPNSEDFVITIPIEKISQVPEFGKAMKDLKNGEISPIIEADGKYYIFKNLGYEEERNFEYGEITQEIANMVMQEKRQSELEKWLKKLRKEIFVEIYE